MLACVTTLEIATCIFNGRKHFGMVYSGWVIVVLSCQEQVTFRGDDDVRFVLYQQAPLDFHSASSLKQ